MGSDKAFLAWQRERLIDHQVATLRALNPMQLMVSGRPGVAYGLTDVPIVHDTTPDQGPLGGLVALLSATAATHLVVLAVDLPMVTPGYLKFLLGHCRDGIGAVPRTSEGWEPLAAVYPQTILREANRRLQEHHLSVQFLIIDAVAAGRMIAADVSESQQAMFRNLNAPDDCL